MRFGAPLFESFTSPQEWAEIVVKRNYGAAYSPIGLGASDGEAIAYGKAAKDAGIVIAEQGAWGVNCLSTDVKERDKALAACIRGLELAELLGARCCVALSGSRAQKWDAPHKANFSRGALEDIASNVRKIIDAVDPKNTYYTLEPMPWTLPCDAKSELKLLEMIDRSAYAVHYDPVNMVYSPERYFDSGKFITDFVEELASFIRVVHLKDIMLLDAFVWQLHERVPGDGELDYDTLLTCISKLDPDLPVITEHLSCQEDYDKAEVFIRGRAKELGLEFVA